MAGDLSGEASIKEQGAPKLENQNEEASLQEDIEEKVDDLVLEPSGNSLITSDLHIVIFSHFLLFLGVTI